MATMKATSPKTELNDRILWYDGDSTVTEDYIVDAASKGQPIDGLFVESMTEGIRQYNAYVPLDQRISVKENVETPDLGFSLPEGYSELNVVDFVSSRLTLELNRGKFSDLEVQERAEVTKRELALYEHLNLFEVLRTLIFVINTLQDKNIVWGVGRGSCVASYVLYLIGVHDVDSVLYDLDIKEFLRS